MIAEVVARSGGGGPVGLGSGIIAGIFVWLVYPLVRSDDESGPAADGFESLSKVNRREGKQGRDDRDMEDPPEITEPPDR
jgi:hypothetical protein